MIPEPSQLNYSKRSDTERSRSVLQFLTTVYFGHGARDELPQLLTKAGVQRPLWVTDPGLIQSGVFQRVEQTLAEPGSFPVFSDTPMNPTETAAVAGATQYREQACDCIIGIGGGAALDQAKAIAILASNPGPLWNYSNRHSTPRSIAEAPSLFLVATTAGTGSEVGRSAVILFDNGIKAGVRCPDLVSAAICDPELTMGLPPFITAATGMDALSHCIETYCSASINPPADAIALDGMQLIFSSIERAVQHGQDRDARWNMMMGSLEGAICFQKGLGSVHALAHPLGAQGFHHGTLNAILLPHVLTYNREWIGHKWGEIAKRSGWGPEADLGQCLSTMIQRLGLPQKLGAIGISRNCIEMIAEQALQDNAHKTNPRPMAQGDYLHILEQAF